MMKANLDPNVEIREKEAHCFHVKVKYVIVNPLDQAHPTTKTEVRAFRKQDYFKIFGGTTKQQIENKKTIGWDTAELVHDPNLIPHDPIVIEGPVRFEPPDEKIKAAKEKELAAIAKEKEAEIERLNAEIKKAEERAFLAEKKAKEDADKLAAMTDEERKAKEDADAKEKARLLEEEKIAAGIKAELEKKKAGKGKGRKTNKAK